MYRFLLRPVWLLFHLIVVVGITCLIMLGFWQLDRLAQRKAFNLEVRERSAQPVVDLSSVLDRLASGELEPHTAEWLRVTAKGTYLPDQVIEFNNSQGGRAGDDVLTALVVDGATSSDAATTVIVNRGFVPLGFDLPPAPTGPVSIAGYIRPSEVRGRGGLTDEDIGGPVTEVRRIDVPLIARQLPGDVAPVFIQLIAAEPPLTIDDPTPVVLPELDNGPHLSYAIQWFIFSSAVALGWVLAVRRSVATRRAEVAQAALRDATEAIDDDASTHDETMDPVTDAAPAAGGADQR